MELHVEMQSVDTDMDVEEPAGPVGFEFRALDVQALRVDYGNRNEQLVTHTSVVVRLEVFTAVTMKNGVFWDVTPYGSCKNRRFGGT
jgi:recombination DNA repair RAD52 pathway protein